MYLPTIKNGSRKRYELHEILTVNSQNLDSNLRSEHDKILTLVYEAAMKQPLHHPTEHEPQNLLERSKYNRLCFLAQFAMASILLPLAAQALPLGARTQPLLLAQATAAEPNPNCTLIVPPQPLTAKGLATPYQLTATDPTAGPCSESVKEQAAFVQAAVIDPANGQISIYNPLVVDKGQWPAKPPVVPYLPPKAKVAIWFGYNGGTLSLQGTDDLANSKCVNGLPGDNFGQMAYCNAPVFFSAARRAIQSGQLQVPPLGTGKDGKACPSVRDFSIVDQDQSDNVLTTYLVTADGKLAQETQANKQALPGATQLKNASDNRLVAIAMNGALGCLPWTATDLADPGQKVAALPLNEIQARVYQSRPIARVPAGDPMVLTNGQPNLEKLNAYRRGVFQRPVSSLESADTKRYCRRLFRVAPARFSLDAPYTKPAASPDPAAATTLYAFLAQRFVATDAVLGCSTALGIENPVTVIRDAGGVAIDAKIRLTADARNQDKLAPAAPADDQQAEKEAAAEASATDVPSGQ